MSNKKIIIIASIVGVISLSIYNIIGQTLTGSYDMNGISAQEAYDISGNIVFPDDMPIPVPQGNLSASETIMLPDLYQAGKGFTCTGLAYDPTTDTFLIGEIGALLPSETSKGSIIRMSTDFSEVIETIPLYNTFPNMAEIQGVAFDTSNNSIWLCSPVENKIRNITGAGVSIGEISVSRPTGISYSANDDSFWILSYDGVIRHLSKSGTVTESYNFAYNEALDQCFLDEYRGLLYIVAGTNYTSRNNVYCFNINTHEQYIACTVDSYAVEGIWLGDSDKMIILNDGYYHSAVIDKNLANIYTIN